ncbi:hypothetical protein X946_2309 [Burkholderia sp. ABCPW 111]|nr:hypothetical protein X946_2309 [Burkholderia sp. ABCPW 111]
MRNTYSLTLSLLGKCRVAHSRKCVGGMYFSLDLSPGNGKNVSQFRNVVSLV